MLIRNAAFRLNLKSNRWENVSSKIGKNQGKFGFQQIVSDGEDVWLVAAATGANHANLLEAPAVPLYRYHAKTGAFEAVQPSVGKRILTRRLTTGKTSVILASSEGVFRFDRAANRWSALTPAPPAGFPLIDAQAVEEDADSYWFVGNDNELQWKK